MNRLGLTIYDAGFGLAIAGYVALLNMYSQLPEPEFMALFSEKGPFEQLSIVSWLFAAIIIIARIRPLGTRAWAFVLLFILFAAREADWNRIFTADSILKIKYYTHSVAPIGEKMIAGPIAIVATGLIIYAGFVILRFLFWQGGWRSRAGFWLLLAAVLVVAGKVLDRAPLVLARDYGIEIFSFRYTRAFEEGLEMIHPLIFAWSIWISQEEKPYLSCNSPALAEKQVSSLSLSSGMNL
ncbi:hypothetical protein [Noviherbaspirillum aridicola]|uniref:Uncharacterized protein n=1 Tax=Noviherbaspirillum aridicola TaxID=2849687 RepID=A0ABQ4Q2T3_9BURK|nr:hypothetical protein [Noviherbaspirillum aridicola]GIZ51341.1 hypothetical protein NCCP691_13550 [Noviherbaspirillum aridicola]